MLKRKRLAVLWPRPLLLAGIMVAPMEAWSVGEWYASFRLDSAYTDNANKSSTNTISERQDQAELSAGADYENQLLAFTAAYEASERRFSDDSQDNRSLLEGNSELEFGKPTDPLGLILSHSRRTVLNAPDDVDLLANNDEREIFSAVPMVRWRPTGVDTLVAQGSFADVNYRFSPQRDSTRQGASLIWLHDLSPADRLRVAGQQSDVEFDAAPAADYRYQSATVAYEVTLRRLSYRLEAGYNKSEAAQGEDLSSPTYQLEATYGEGLSYWHFSARQFITDNSAGSGNQGDLGGFSPGDASAGDLDQLERTRAELRWTTDAVCARCAVSVSVYHQQDDFRVELEDRQEQGVKLGLDYRLSNRASIDTGWERRDQSFDEGVGRTDFELDRLHVRYEYRFTGGLELDLYYRRDERRSDSNAPEYQENMTGVGLAYTF